MVISLSHNSGKISLVPVSGKEARRHQFGICYGPWHQRVTLRAPTNAIYETWWAALENILALPHFVALPIIDAPNHQVKLTPVRPARYNVQHSKLALETVMESVDEDDSTDSVPMLEAGGPSSPTELDILASWRTWGSLECFATPPTIASPAAISIRDDCSDRFSVYSDISEFWSRPSEDEKENEHVVYESKIPVVQKPITLHPQDGDDEEWLDEIALYAFRQKVGASCEPKRRPKRDTSGKLHSLLTYALL
ncbi:unnamed protein product [Phytophthora lilii]|uniref:Unnamed protein product n=1 Tax=Phytophthora lilii TaxID=2077276 RepID=A0A9W6UC93_9STRA|nr:unnamed protein product [Phytophthora lilii]